MLYINTRISGGSGKNGKPAINIYLRVTISLLLSTSLLYIIARLSFQERTFPDSVLKSSTGMFAMEGRLNSKEKCSHVVNVARY